MLKMRFGEAVKKKGFFKTVEFLRRGKI